MIWVENRLDALQMRLVAAAMVFYAVALTIQLEPFLQYMAMCWFFALAVIPLRFGMAVVEICGLYFEWRRDNSPGPIIVPGHHQISL